VHIDDADIVSVQVTGTWVGTLTFQGSLDGTNWFDMTMGSINGTVTPATSTTVNGIFNKPAGAGILFFRCNMTAYTSGTVGFLITAHRMGRA
jgi:hypothetical protein